METFTAAEELWLARLGNLRNTVRQALIERQLEAHIRNGASVLDVGCGQGTQAIRLARRGCTVMGVDPSSELLRRLSTDAAEAGVQIETHPGRVEDLAATLGARTFEVVCAHGLLMYLDEPEVALAALAAQLSPGGLLSVTFRNAAALAFRPGMRRQWQSALDAFDADTYINELGVRARAHHLHDVSRLLSDLGLSVEAWYGVRVFTEPAPGDETVEAGDIALLLDAETEAGRRDPYRQLAAQIHILARAPAAAQRASR